MTRVAEQALHVTPRVMLIANDRTIMGSRTNRRWLNVVGWATAAAMFAAALGLVVTWSQ